MDSDTLKEPVTVNPSVNLPLPLTSNVVVGVKCPLPIPTLPSTLLSVIFAEKNLPHLLVSDPNILPMLKSELGVTVFRV